MFCVCVRCVGCIIEAREYRKAGAACWVGREFCVCVPIKGGDRRPQHGADKGAESVQYDCVINSIDDVGRMANARVDSRVSDAYCD